MTAIQDFADQEARTAMIDCQLRPSDVNDPDVLAAFARVAREDFLPASAADFAYMDRPIPLGNGRFVNPPLVQARLIGAAGDVVGKVALLIGAAGGYAAAILADLGAHVVALDDDAALIAGCAGIDGVTAIAGPMAGGAPAYAPFDIIIIDGAIAQLPAALIDQLCDGGRIVTGLADGALIHLARGIKVGGEVALVPFADLECVVLHGFARPQKFQF